jgi:predicted acyltransferase
MTNPAPASKSVQRLLSLDVLRGITIAFMIMVNNNGGSGSWGFMNHAAWNGLTPTDLVFPTFVFVVGVSIVFAFDVRLARGATRAQLAWHTLKRAGILFLLGIVVNGFPFFELAHLRIYGVLQRIAVCYLVVGLFYLWDQRIWTKVVVLVAALAAYWVLLRWVPVPGSGLPGRDIPFLDKDMNLVAWLDRHIFPYHLYENWATHNLRDPEGLLSDLPAVCTALLGLLTGLWLRGQRAVKAKTMGLAAACVALLATGYLWAGRWPCSRWPGGPLSSGAGAAANAIHSCGRGWSSAPTPSWHTCSANCCQARWGSFASPGAAIAPTCSPGRLPTSLRTFPIAAGRRLPTRLPTPRSAFFRFGFSIAKRSL